MELFSNLIYEYKKGMRDMAMYSCQKDDCLMYTKHLVNNDVEFISIDAGGNKINLFFGNPDCLELFKQFSSEKLNELTDYEDFILGIMLGYSRDEQYKRLLGRKSNLCKLACST